MARCGSGPRGNPDAHLTWTPGDGVVVDGVVGVVVDVVVVVDEDTVSVVVVLVVVVSDFDVTSETLGLAAVDDAVGFSVTRVSVVDVVVVVVVFFVDVVFVAIDIASVER